MLSGNKIIHLNNPINKTIMNGSCIPPGTFFYGKITNYAKFDNVLFYRSYNKIITLDDTNGSWDECINITDYRPVSVTILVNGYI